MAKVALLLIGLGSSRAAAETCFEPFLENGSVDGEGGDHLWTGTFNCNPGFTLVGNTRLKCRKGVWSSSLPTCTAMGKCDPNELPDIAHGEKKSHKPGVYRGSVFKYKCDRGFRMHGSSLLTCAGDHGWDLSRLPLCARPGCDETLVSRLPYGQAKRRAKGAVYVFRCNDGSTMEGSSTVVCDGHNWNSSAPICLSAAPAPSLTLGVDGVLAKAHLTPNQRVLINCESRGGSPHPTLALSLDGAQLATSSNGPISQAITAAAELNTKVLACSAINRAMEEHTITETVLRVHFGPQSVVIGGANTLVQGQASGFSCVSSSSNPPADIEWEVIDANGDKLSGVLQESEPETSWTGHGWETESNVIFTPDSGLTSVTLICSATNPTLGQAAIAEKRLLLQYAPDRVSVSGPSRVRAGDQAVLSCTSSPAVPAASIRWTIKQDGKEVERSESPEVEVEQKEDGSFVTHSHLSIKAGAGPDLEAVCYATNEVLGADSVALVHNVVVISPPGVPTISGVQPHSSVQHLNCSTRAGRPPAQLSWYRGSEMMDSHYTVDGDTVSAVITFVPSHTNNEELTCEASNEALAEPIRNTITIQPSTTSSSSSSQPSTTTMKSSSTATWVKLDMEHQAAVKEETGYDEYNYDEDYLPDYVFNDTDATKESDKSSKASTVVDSNEIPEIVGGDLDEDLEEDATMGENTGVEATREGKILGGAHVKSLETAGVSLEQVVLTSEEKIKDSSSDSDDKMLEIEESKEDTPATEKDENNERERSEARTSTASSVLASFSLISTSIIALLSSTTISSLAFRN